MEFTTMFKHHPRRGENFSNKEQKIYKVSINKKTGERELIVDKVINLYDKIQEYAEDVKISNILKKYDLDLYNQLKDEEEKLIDLTNMPENLMETMAAIDNAKYIWDRQSKELKNKFENSFEKFIASSENGQLATILNEELNTSVDKFASHVQADMPQSVVNNSIRTESVSQQVVQPTSTTITQVTGGNSNV